MKQVIRLFMIVAATTVFATMGHAQSDAIQRYFEKYMNDPKFDMVYISPKMFEMVSKIDLEGDNVDPEVKDIIKDLKGLRILSYDGPEGEEYYKEALSKINLNEYSELLTARDGKENVNIRVKDNGDIVNELLLIVGGDDEFVLISFSGNIDLKKVGKLGSILNIDHMKELERIDEK